MMEKTKNNERYNKKPITKITKAIFAFLGILLLALSVSGCLKKTYESSNGTTPAAEASITIIEHDDSISKTNSENGINSSSRESAPGHADGFIENRIENIPYYFLSILSGAVNNIEDGKNMEESFFYLEEMISMADEYNIKLTLMFSARWADYISGNPGRLALLNEWKENGHEVAGIHLGIYSEYWDGYTDFTLQQAVQVRSAMGKYGEKYNGTLNDFISRLKRINPDIKSGCVIGRQNKASMPDEILYDTSSLFSNYMKFDHNTGYGIHMKGVNEYVMKEAVGGIEKKLLGSSLVKDEESLSIAIKATGMLDSRSVYGAAAYSIKGQIPFFYAYLDYLNSLDPEALNSKTLKSIIEKQLIPEKDIP